MKRAVLSCGLWLCVGLGIFGCEEDSNVGQACMPADVPSGGFSDREPAIELSSEQCQSDPCLVYRLNGDPTRVCSDSGDDACLSQEKIAERVYCSCRCAGAPEGEPECECPSDFQCLPLFELGGPSVEGSYCVRTGTF